MSGLPEPPRGIGRIELRTVEIAVSALYRISRRSTGEPYFGRSGANRFDDPSRARSRRFGTCYVGLGLEVAIAETVLHDEMPVRGSFRVAAQELEDRYCIRFAGDRLRLADLTGASLKALVGSGEISTTTPCDRPQRWARALHRHPANVDGLLYMSRHVNSERAVVVFDRAAAKLAQASCTPLPQTAGALAAVMNLRIVAAFV